MASTFNTGHLAAHELTLRVKCVGMERTVDRRRQRPQPRNGYYVHIAR